MSAVLPADDADEAAPAWMSRLSARVQRRLLRFGIRTADELLAFPWHEPQWVGFFGVDGMQEIESIAAQLREARSSALEEAVQEDARARMRRGSASLGAVASSSELDRELEAAVAACVAAEDARVVIAWIGLDRPEPPTATQLAARFEWTPARVRQCVERCAALAHAPGLQLRVLSGLVQGLENAGVLTVAEAQASMHGAGLTSASVAVAGMLRAAEFFGIAHHLVVDDDPAGALIGEPVRLEAVQRARRVVTRLLAHGGSTSVTAVARETDDDDVDEITLRSVLAADPRVRWLDRDRESFWMPTGPDDRLRGTVPTVEQAAAMTVGELAQLAGMQLEELVALALGSGDDD
jgi:hypothetical protein